MPSASTRDEVTDPSDWSSKPAALAALHDVDGALRCDICKDFYTSPVITTCSHTFCSLCIRRCLAAEGRCPNCRTPEQESRLKRNDAVGEVVESFMRARKGLLELGKELNIRGEERKANVDGAREDSGQRRRSKRKREDIDDADQGDDRPARRTRSQRKAASQVDGAFADEPMVIDSDDDQDAEYTPTPTASQQQQPAEPEDGLVACPICSQRMKEAAVSAHLDTSCPGFTSAQKPAAATSKSSSSKPPSSLQSQSRTKPTKPPPDRLPQLSYSLFNDQKLRKKLSELGIPSFGSRQLLQRRHAEWLALWNANCDAKEPKSRRQLLQELDAWERSQGGHAKNNGEAVKSEFMEKDFDGSGWAKKNKGDFDDLILKARESRGKKRKDQSEAEGEGSPQAESKPHQHSPSREAEHDPANEHHQSIGQPTTMLAPPSSPSPIERPLTAPPSTDAMPPPSQRPSFPTTEEPPPLPSLTKQASMPEPVAKASATLPIPNPPALLKRPSLNDKLPTPPPPASLMFSHSSASVESTDTTTSPRLPNAAPLNTYNLPSISVSAAQRQSMTQPREGVGSSRRGSVAAGSRRGSIMVDGVAIETKESGSGNPEAPTRLPMFQVPSRPVVDGDATGVK